MGLSISGQSNEIVCPTCDNRQLKSEDPCPDCEGGWVEIPGCPNAYCGEMINVSELIDFFHKGLPPISGGVLDQSAWFLHASKLLKSYENEFRQQRASQ